jgi:hypothetical protein
MSTGRRDVAAGRGGWVIGISGGEVLARCRIGEVSTGEVKTIEVWFSEALLL